MCLLSMLITVNLNHYKQDVHTFYNLPVERFDYYSHLKLEFYHCVLRKQIPSSKYICVIESRKKVSSSGKESR